MATIKLYRAQLLGAYEVILSYEENVCGEDVIVAVDIVGMAYLDKHNNIVHDVYDRLYLDHRMQTSPIAYYQYLRGEPWQRLLDEGVPAFVAFVVSDLVSNFLQCYSPILEENKVILGPIRWWEVDAPGDVLVKAAEAQAREDARRKERIRQQNIKLLLVTFVALVAGALISLML